MSDQRRRLAHSVLVEGRSVSGAARDFGVSRATAHLWVSRAREKGLSSLEARSRRPLRSPNRTPEELSRTILDLAASRPHWGGRKIHAALWPDAKAPVSARTVERILARAGRGGKGSAPAGAVGRFEKESPNELWQADFKGLGERPPPYRVLSVLDDHSRFAVALEVVLRATDEEIFEAFWRIFGERGLPEALLTDNEACFHSRSSKGPSFLEARLWRLGVATLHGRPAHPQTQGKVERFHRSMEKEMGSSLRAPRPEDAKLALDRFREDYNWARPHEALGMRPPGVVYAPSPRSRPERLPELEHPDGAEIRKVDSSGRFVRKGARYQAGRGIAGESVALVEGEEGLLVVYAGKAFAKLEELEV